MHDGHDSDKYLRLLGVRLAHLVFENEKVESSYPLCLFWKRRETESMEYISDASNDSLLLPTSKLDGNGEDSDGASREVICLDEPQPCPICKVTLPKELSLVNQHIDECLNREVISGLQNTQNTNKSTLKCGSPKYKMPKKRLMKGTVPNKTPKNSLENYLIRKPAKI
ncbi:hypothetical protein WUBG_10128 [Wuchereria bancrofti]|uniref:UBZ4-type domain-containing protein n=3 Tax=Wuchereria bancrofti TaxID=6293 RepID=J9EUT1_WUCBA|nr:hypothetical protein WUBG_10128 [Wuchereria bancrofti]